MSKGSKAASMALLEQLHAKTAKVLLDALNDEPSPQMLAQVIKFLQNNGVEPAGDADNEAMQALAKRISDIAENGSNDDVLSIVQ